MEQIGKWINDNREWLFSGAAIAGISLLGKFLYSFLNRKRELAPSLNNNQSQNVTVNVTQPSIISKESSIEKSTALIFEGIRVQTNILFIDDDKRFKIVSILKKAGWKNTSFLPDADVKDINTEKIRNAHIIFVDIKGVGQTMYKDEGLGLVVDLKKKYPQKKVVIYSAIPEHSLFHDAIKLADDQISKNSQPAVFVSLIETLAEEIWKDV